MEDRRVLEEVVVPHGLVPVDGHILAARVRQPLGHPHAVRIGHHLGEGGNDFNRLREILFFLTGIGQAKRFSPILCPVAASVGF